MQSLIAFIEAAFVGGLLVFRTFFRTAVGKY